MAAQPQDHKGRVVRGLMRTCPPPCPQVPSATPSSRDPLPRSPSGAARHRVGAGTSGTHRASRHLLQTRGFSEVEASRLVAYLAGLRPAGHGWTLRELDRLLFFRWLVDSRRPVS